MNARARMWVGACLVPLFLIAGWCIGVGLVDDAYIFLRYASNTYHGAGVVFNAGDRVEGYTSPLWLALTVPLFAIADEPSAYLMILGGVFGLASVLLIAWRRSLLGGAFLATNPAFVFWSFSGLETPLAALCLLVTFLLLMEGELTRRRIILAGLTFSLAMLARPDSVWLLPFVICRILVAAWPDPRRTLGMALFFVLPLALVGVHLAWRISYYGEWLPNTYDAKAGIPAAVLLSNGWRYLISTSGFLIALVLAVPLMPRAYRWALVPLLASWIAMVLNLGGDFFAFFRFGVPLLAVVALGIGTATASRSPKSVLTATLAILLLGSNILLAIGPNRDLARREVSMARAWSRTGQALAGLVPPDGTIATLVAGAIPYYAARPTVDLLGLTDRRIAQHGRIEPTARPGHQRYDSDYVLERRPLVIVLPDSGRAGTPRHAAARWPEYSSAERRYFNALTDLIGRRDTQALYEYRAIPLADGTYLEALWLREGR